MTTATVDLDDRASRQAYIRASLDRYSTTLVPGGRRVYKKLAPGPFGWAPLGVPPDAHEQCLHVLRYLQDPIMDWCHGVQIRWFDHAGPGDREGDPDVFVADQPIRGCVERDDPRTVWIHLDMSRRPRPDLIRTTVHECSHAQQLAVGLQRKLSYDELEAMAHAIVGDLTVGLVG